MFGKIFAPIVLVSLVFVMAATANAQQKGGFLGRSLELTSEDLELQRKAARNALDNLADGVVESWHSSTVAGGIAARTPRHAAPKLPSGRVRALLAPLRAALGEK